MKYLFPGKHKKGNNYIESNDVSDGEAENSSKRKGKYFLPLLLINFKSIIIIVELMVGEPNGDSYDYSSSTTKASSCLFFVICFHEIAQLLIRTV